MTARIEIAPTKGGIANSEAALPALCASRLATCTDTTLTYTSLDDKGEVTGEIVYDDQISQTTSPNSGTVAIKVELQARSVEGSNLGGILTINVQGGGAMNLIINRALRDSVGSTEYTPPVVLGTAGTHAQLTGTIQPFDGVQVSGFSFSDPSVVRCDATVRAAVGCVNPEVVPTFDMTGYTNITPNVIKWQSEGQPGAPGGIPLTKVPGEEGDQNRADGPCKVFPSPRPTGQQCDEYPFASTAQGGPGARAALVPAGENRSQGGNINQFYRSNRVVPGDNFYVKVI